MQQAIGNLLDNALAYGPAGGKVVVDWLPEERFVTIRVRDTGPGLRQEDLTRIWRRFVRGSAAEKAPSGIGLGLSLVKAVAHAHGGETGAGNAPGGGAEFWIRLPLGAS
jgi:signal transduction histidine kinase